MISMWDWETTVGAWRYYSHGGTIAAAMFPREMVQRYFGEAGKKKWTDEDRDRIAVQFCKTDYPRQEKFPGTPLTKEWRECWAFLDAWLNGAWEVTVRYDGKEETVDCFKIDGEYRGMADYADFGPDGRIVAEYIVRAVRWGIGCARGNLTRCRRANRNQSIYSKEG